MDAVTVERQGPVTTVRLSRPHARNAVDGVTAAALADAFRAFDADPDASVAVLHGDGGTFCAGADLRAVGTPAGNRTEPDGDGPMGPTRLRLRKPVIAAIAGHAVAGGLELALWCDLRVADETAVLGVYCRRWGVPLIDGGTVRLPRLIGASRAMDLDPHRPVGRRRRGAADRPGQPGRPGRAGRSPRRRRWRARIAAFPQTCLREDRASLLEQDGLDEAAALANEFAHGMTSLAVDALPGAARFAAGRGPPRRRAPSS